MLFRSAPLDREGRGLYGEHKARRGATIERDTQRPCAEMRPYVEPTTRVLILADVAKRRTANRATVARAPLFLAPTLARLNASYIDRPTSSANGLPELGPVTWAWPRGRPV